MRWTARPLGSIAGGLLWAGVACNPPPESLDRRRLGSDSREELLSTFHVGVNLPWRSYGNDFGSNSWNVGGISEHALEVDLLLRQIADAGIPVVRWFVWSDGRAGIDFDAHGWPIQVQEHALDDLHLLLDLAHDHSVFIVPVLFDHPWCAPEQIEDEVRMGGHCALLAQPDGRSAMVDHVVRPTVAAVADHPGVLAWDLFNEPEWATVELGGDWLDDAVAMEDMLDFTRTATQVIRDESDHYVTVGSATAAWAADIWARESLDLITVHSYDRAAQTTDAEQIHAGVPVVVGELGTAAAYGDLTANLGAIHARGYAGAWPWSLRADDDASDLDLETIARWSPPDPIAE